jgi:acyl-CoA thioester hydrolase
MQQLQFGPILLREECNFRREIISGDSVSIDLMLTKSKNDFSRWTIQHYIHKNENILAAVLTVDGAWMDVNKRKLASPPEQVHHVFSAMPKTDTFQWLD